MKWRGMARLSPHYKNTKTQTKWHGMESGGRRRMHVHSRTSMCGIWSDLRYTPAELMYTKWSTCQERSQEWRRGMGGSSAQRVRSVSRARVCVVRLDMTIPPSINQPYPALVRVRQRLGVPHLAAVHVVDDVEVVRLAQRRQVLSSNEHGG